MGLDPVAYGGHLFLADQFFKQVGCHIPVFVRYLAQSICGLVKLTQLAVQFGQRLKIKLNVAAVVQAQQCKEVIALFVTQHIRRVPPRDRRAQLISGCPESPAAALAHRPQKSHEALVVPAKTGTRAIEGVIKADDEASLIVELDEYVLTNEVAKRLDNFLDAYTNYTVANGVWISGFFGSGKSHLLKLLALVLESRSVDGRNAADIFYPNLRMLRNTPFTEADVARYLRQDDGLLGSDATPTRHWRGRWTTTLRPSTLKPTSSRSTNPKTSRFATMLREAIINALVHSDYSQRGTPIPSMTVTSPPIMGGRLF